MQPRFQRPKWRERSNVQAIKCHHCKREGRARVVRACPFGDGLFASLAWVWVMAPRGWFACGSTDGEMSFRCPQCCKDRVRK